MVTCNWPPPPPHGCNGEGPRRALCFDCTSCKTNKACWSGRENPSKRRSGSSASSAHRMGADAFSHYEIIGAIIIII